MNRPNTSFSTWERFSYELGSLLSIYLKGIFICKALRNNAIYCTSFSASVSPELLASIEVVHWHSFMHHDELKLAPIFRTTSRYDCGHAGASQAAGQKRPRAFREIAARRRWYLPCPQVTKGRRWPHAKELAPPDSIASISACVKGVRLNLAGSSSLSKNSPLAGSMEPSDAPE